MWLGFSPLSCSWISQLISKLTVKNSIIQKLYVWRVYLTKIGHTKIGVCSYSIKIGLRNCPVIQDEKKWIPLGLILRPQSCLTTKLFPFWVLSLFSTFALSSRISTYGFLDIVALLCLTVINEKNDRQATLTFEWPWYLLWFSVCVHTLLIDFKILFSDWSKEFCPLQMNQPEVCIWAEISCGNTLVCKKSQLSHFSSETSPPAPECTFLNQNNILNSGKAQRYS